MATTSNLRTVTVTGGNLFQIAMQYLGDATQWNRIATINGLWDPMIVGTVTLVIPTSNPALTGGVFATANAPGA